MKYKNLRRFMNCAPPPSLRTTHFALRIQTTAVISHKYEKPSVKRRKAWLACYHSYFYLIAKIDTHQIRSYPPV